MAHEKTIHPREFKERMAPMAWMGFAVGALASGRKADEAGKIADAMTSQFQQRFVSVDDEREGA